MSRIK
jgi:hypothetical protein